jgi:hypothetical protein
MHQVGDQPRLYNVARSTNHQKKKKDVLMFLNQLIQFYWYNFNNKLHILAQEGHHLAVYRNIKGNKIGYYVHNHDLLHFLVYFYIKPHDGLLGQNV